MLRFSHKSSVIYTTSVQVLKRRQLFNVLGETFQAVMFVAAEYLRKKNEGAPLDPSVLDEMDDDDIIDSVETVEPSDIPSNSDSLSTTVSTKPTLTPSRENDTDELLRKCENHENSKCNLRFFFKIDNTFLLITFILGQDIPSLYFMIVVCKYFKWKIYAMLFTNNL